MQAKPPRIVTAALVLPLGALEDELPADAPIHAVETKEVERRGVELVLAAERALGRNPDRAGIQQPGLRHPLRSADGEDPIRIEVKARIAGAEDFFVTHNEVLDGTQQRAALPPRARPRRPDAARARRGPLPRQPVRRLRRRRLRRDRPPRRLGHDLGAGPGAVLSR